MSSANEALERLREGNRRFVAGEPGPPLDPARRDALAAGQAPFAVVLGCADSRVPPELVFDQHPGELFTVRVAGAIPSPAAVGSIEYAVQALGARLVVVLGHSACGAVQAALSDLESPLPDASPELRSILAQIQPAVSPLLEGAALTGDELVARAVGANVRAAAEHLRRTLPADVHVVGAEYDLGTGRVELHPGGA
jgi:carbonic anhydrase